jgi:hypothetical protein
MAFGMTTLRLLEGALLVSLDVLPVFLRPAPPSKEDDRQSRTSGKQRVILLLVTGGALLVGLQAWRGAAPFALLWVTRRLASRTLTAAWPSWLPSSSSAPSPHHPLIQSAIRGGPLGPHAAKAVHSSVGLVVVILGGAVLGLPSQPATTTGPLLRPAAVWSDYCRFGTALPTNPALWWLPCIVLLGSVVVNGVLWLWSWFHQRQQARQQSSKPPHEGVQRMVASTLGHPLTRSDRARLAGWAVLNAICEEVTSRGLNRYEFAQVFGGRESTTNSLAWTDPSNLGQALVFGLLHYYGIPSGWSGVVLTFVYGYLMGVLADAAGGGLLYPIVAHSLADYFIFCQIARRPSQ